MLLRTVYDDKLAQASYLVGCQVTGAAMVVDPNRDAEQYVRLAKKEGLRITHVTETHIHADFVSGTRELARRTGATMYLSREGGREWSYRFANDKGAVLIGEADTFDVGSVRVRVLHTPGHTPEHICLLISDTTVTDQPMGIFTGDCVFVGDVGRPDLLEKATGVRGTMEGAARQLFSSLDRFRQLPDYLQVWPAHGAGSACGKALGAVPQSTIGYEKLFSPPFQIRDESEFVDYILSGQPEPPTYFAQMKRLNRDGPPVLGELRIPPPLHVDALPGLLERGLVVDARAASAFARGHLRGTINIPYNRAFPTWAGWLIPYDREFALILDKNTASALLPDVARDLALIGFDNSAGYFTSDVIAANNQLQMLPSIPTPELEQYLQSGATVIDVRGRSEWLHGHIPGVRNIPVGYLRQQATEIPRDKPVAVHCQSGSRSAIAASVLQALGFEDVVSVRGGFGEWAALGRSVESG